MDSTQPHPWIDSYRKDPDSAWEMFISRYNKLVMAVIHKLVDDYDEAMDLYVYTLEKVKERDCKRLTDYSVKPRSYGFDTWIAVVARNCCMDWFRKEKGRKRLLKCIENMPEIDQWTFRYTYWHKYSYDTTFLLLKSKHGFEGSFEELLSIVAQIENSLQRGTHWKFQQNWHSILPARSIESYESGQKTEENPGTGEKDPTTHHLIREDTLRYMEEYFGSLSPEEQMIIHLHYYRDRSLREVARIMKLGSVWKVHRILHKALQKLKKNLLKKGIGPSDLDQL